MSDAATRLTSALADRYRLERELGQGGMATVYLAQDLRHDRKVAIKVLRPELAAVIGGERFLAEIRTTANLQHPHILSLFDSGEVGGTVFYVMPFVEGESLRDRLTRETQLPIDVALRIANEVADALGYAHGKGIIHRDIKPENILLHGGHALVADFGIALAVSRSEGGSRMTETGMSLGTPHYMSPEQAMGERTLDQRTDIYALGAMTYEMLVGEPPFTGPSAQAIIAKVMTGEPASLIAQRKTVPPHVEAAVFIALSKLPADRFATVADFAASLADPGRALPTVARPTARAGFADPWRRRALGLGVVTLVAAGLAAWGWLRPAPPPQPSSQHITLYLKGNRPATLLRSARLSPDGERIVFPDTAGGGLQLWSKDRDQAEAEPIPGTTGAVGVTGISPDGEWVAFITRDGVLRKVPRRGGTAVELVKNTPPAAWAGAWLADGTILFSPNFQLVAVADTGGPVRTIVSSDAGIVAITPLPDGKSALVTRCTAFCVSGVDVWLVSLADGSMRLLLPETARAWPLADGRLLYVRRNGSVYVARWDRQRGTVATAGEPLLEGILTGFRGLPFLSFSQSGSLLYMPGMEELNGRRQLYWVDRTGRPSPVDSSWRVIFGPRQSIALAPAGDRAAIVLQSDTGGNTLWVKALDRGPATRLTATTRGLGSPSWSADGRRVAYVISDSSGSSLWTRAADGSDEPSLVFRLAGTRLNAVRWAPDGRSFVGAAEDHSNERWIWSFRPGTDTVPVRIPEPGSQPTGPSVSPDGRWLAYSARQGDAPEIYVRPYPNTRDGRWQVSTGGGVEALWAPDSRALYYREVKPAPSRPEDSKLTVATLRFAPSFTVVSREGLFPDVYGRTSLAPNYALSADGRRFLMVETSTLAPLKSLDLVLLDHWAQGIPREGAK